MARAKTKRALEIEALEAADPIGNIRASQLKAGMAVRVNGRRVTVYRARRPVEAPHLVEILVAGLASAEEILAYDPEEILELITDENGRRSLP